jgi:hypothetical protein
MMIRAGLGASEQPLERERAEPAPAAELHFWKLRAVSSAGRAPALQAGGRWFEPGTAH